MGLLRKFLTVKVGKSGVLPPVETAGLTTDDIPGLVRECHDTMAATIESLEAGYENGQSSSLTQGDRL